jgi:hypothetical protein
MRLPRVRFTVRRMMVAVAVVAIISGSVQLWRLRRLYQDRASGYASMALRYVSTPEEAAYWEARWTRQREGRPAEYPWPAGPPFVPAIVAHYRSLQAKYEHAARYPWLTVVPDTPEPKRIP